MANLIVKYQKNKDDANADASAESVAAAENAAETAPESAVASADMDEEDADSLYVPYFNPNIGIEKDEIMPQIGSEVTSQETESEAEEANEEDAQVTYAPIRKVDIQTIEQESLAGEGANAEAEAAETSPMEEILKAATPTVSESAPVPETFHSTKTSAMPMAMSQGSITQDKTPMGTDKIQAAPVSAPAAPAMSAPATSTPAPEIPAATTPSASKPTAAPSTTAPSYAVPSTAAPSASAPTASAPSMATSATPATSSTPALSSSTPVTSPKSAQDEAPKAKRSVFANLFSSSKNQQEAQSKPNTQQTNQMNDSKPTQTGNSNKWKSYSGV